MPGVKPILISTLALALLSLSLFGDLRAAERTPPFSPAEKLTFQVKWVFVPAGEAVLEVLPMEIVNGMKSFHFAMTARTNEFVDLFYKVRDRIDAYTDADMTHSVLYRKRQAGKRKRDVLVRFDWESRQAEYSDFGDEGDPVSLLPGSFDPLSVFYAFRLHDLREGMLIETPVTDGKKCVQGKARVVKREKIDVEGNTYDTYLVEPDLEHIGGVFKKSKDAKLQLWVTADERRIPVRVKSRVAVGSFVADLVSIE